LVAFRAGPMAETERNRAWAETRLEALRAERALESRDEANAALDYEIGSILEHLLGQDADALRHYLLAFNESPSFRPAFDALARVLERRGSSENLARLHLSDLNGALTRQARASARTALGSVDAKTDSWDRAADHFRTALDEDPSSPVPPAFLELAARRSGEERLLTLALERRIATTRDPALVAAYTADRVERGDFSLPEKIKRLSAVPDPDGAATRALADAHLELGDHAARARALVEAAEKLAGSGYATEAALLFAEAAAVQLEVLFAPRAALEHARRATELVDAPSVRLLAWEAARRCDDRAALEALEREILSRDTELPTTDVHVESALRALERGALDAARDHARRAFEGEPTTATLLFLDAVSARMGAHRERVDRLSSWARAGGEAASWAWVMASDIAERDLRDTTLAAELARAARALGAESAEASARAFDLAKRSGDPKALDEAASVLARQAVTDETREAALFERMSLRVREPAFTTEDDLLADVLAAQKSWAGELVRMYAVRARRPEWIGRAHEALASTSTDDATRAAHLSAAARFRLMERDLDGAAARLHEALAARPHHPYALALAAKVEELRGRRDAAESLRARREQARGARGGEPLKDALEAEGRGDLDAAARAYAARGDDALALDGLRRLAPLVDPEASTRSYSVLAAEGAPGAKVAAIELSLRGLGATRPGLDPRDLELAWDVMLSERSESARVEASEALSAGDPKLVPLMLVARHLDGLAGSVRFEPKAEGLLARYVQCRSELPGTRAAALGSLVDEATDERRELAMLSIALRANQGDAASSDAFIDAQALRDERHDGYSAVAIEETVSFADDPAQLGAALLDRIAVSSPDLEGTLRAAAARALAHAGADALDAARRAVADDPEDLASWDTLRVAARNAEDFKRLTRACEVLADAAPARWASALLDEAGVAHAEKLGDLAAAEDAFLKALRADPRSGVALNRLRDLYREAERDDARIALLSQYAATAPEDDPELTSVLYELAGSLRIAGRLEEASAYVERLVSGSVDEPAALALAAEIHVARAKWDDAVRMMRRLAVADVPASQQRIARLAAADFLEKKLDRPDAALIELGELVTAGLADAKAVERMAKLNLRLGRHEDAAQAYEAAGRRLTGAEAARLLVLAGKLRAHELGDLPTADQLYRRALQLHPLALDAVVGLMELTVDLGESRRLAERASEILRAALPLSRCDVALIRAIHSLAAMRGDHERAAAMIEALVALGSASHDELTRSTEVTTIVKPRGFSSDTLLQAIGELAEDHPLRRFGQHLMPSLLGALGIGLEALGFTRNDRLTSESRSPVRDELNEIAARFGTGPFELYRGGRNTRAIHLVPMKKGAAWLVGEEVKSPLPPASRFSAAAQCAGFVRGTLPFILVDQAHAEALIARFAIAEDRPIPGLAADPALLGKYDGIEESRGFFGRRSNREILGNLGSAEEIALAITASRLEAHRAGLAVLLEIHEALRALVGGEVTPASVEANPDALALLSFWIRPEASEFRALAGAHG
jgi:hypothetical protein